jgi:hypothetical protein
MIKGRDLRYFALGAIIVASGLSVWAAVTIPNTFTAGTPIKSAEVNANFSSLKAFVDALETNKQTRVAATCAAGSSIRAIATDGTVTCEADDGGPGGVTYTAGAGLTLAGSEFSVNTAAIQSRVTGTCAAGAISAIAANGTVTCAPAGSLSVPASLIGDSGGDTTPALTLKNTRVTGSKIAFDVEGAINVKSSSVLPGLAVLVPSGSATAINGESSGLGTGVLGKSSGGQGVYGWAVTAGDGVFGTAPSGKGVNGSTATGVGVQANASGTGTAFEANASTGDIIKGYSAGGANLRFKVSNVGQVTADGAFVGGGADVAEFVPATESLEPSDVVEIGINGQFRLTRTASSTAVAGVITTKPGVLMNASDQRQTLEDGPALALVGRVPVKVSAENGAIKPGDLLVASGTPGHAMKAPANPAAGTVIGKSLGSLETGTGRVEMLVMLR